IVAGSDAGIRLLGETGEVIWSQRLRHPVTALAISEDGSRILAGTRDNMVRCFDRDGKEVWAHETGGWVRDIAVSKDGSRILAGSMDKQAYLFDGAGEVLGIIYPQ
ncbi:MAG: PQQ-binding-like beta-propeller repeat protein, partial [Methanomicrobiales archaeon]|nr:PQQ-binding-like beta-propeller repeat protein [Methanomicrobiales archaeon]